MENQPVDNSDQMQMMLTAIAKKHDQEKIKAYEVKIEKALQIYLSDCLVDETNVKNTQGIEKTSKDLLAYLISAGERDEAYSITSMTFILSWTKTINELAKTITTEKEVENLQKATDIIRDFVEKTFLEPMSQILAESDEE